MIRRRSALTGLAVTAASAVAGSALLRRPPHATLSAPILPAQVPSVELARVPDVEVVRTMDAGEVAPSLASVPRITSPAKPRWQRLAVAAPPAHGRPTVTVVIDDMGVMHPYTRIAMELPGPLTLSWFPFAEHLQEQIDAAMARGHETTLHMPMQSFSNSIAQTGPDPLRIDLPPAENIARLQAAIAAIPNAVGLNNHMGSVATRNVPLMELMATIAHEHEMLFLDSLTITHSVALQQAREASVPAIARDVFIDDSANKALIRAQLELTERLALRNGRVVAIGHPRRATLAALQEWLPTLAPRGFVLTPLSATVAAENNIVFT